MPPTWLDCEMQDVVYGVNRLVRRSMQYNDDGSDEADGAADLAQYTKKLVQKVGTQYGSVGPLG